MLLFICFCFCFGTRDSTKAFTLSYIPGTFYVSFETGFPQAAELPGVGSKLWSFCLRFPKCWDYNRCVPPGLTRFYIQKAMKETKSLKWEAFISGECPGGVHTCCCSGYF